MTALRAMAMRIVELPLRGPFGSRVMMAQLFGRLSTSEPLAVERTRSSCAATEMRCFRNDIYHYFTSTRASLARELLTFDSQAGVRETSMLTR